MKFAETVCAIVCLICLSNSISASHSFGRSEEVAAIQTYCKSVDRFIRRDPKNLRIFANIASGAHRVSDWREFKTEEERDHQDTGDNLNANAFVWTKRGEIVGANFTFQSGSRDWAQFVMYYYRNDGSLAKTVASLNTFYGHMTVIREQLYDESGRLIASSKKYLDMETGKKKKADENFIDESFPVYKRTTLLPCYTIFLARGINSRGSK